MKAKVVLPWVLVLGLAVALGVVYSSSQQQAAELAKLRQESDELQKVRAASEEAKSNQTQAESDELTQLRKEHDELLKLRNDIGQLRIEKDQLAKQATLAKQPSANPEEQQQLQALMAENMKLKATAQQTQQTAQQVTCINNLRQIEAAKQQWALENQKPPGSLVGPPDIAPYMPTKAVPVCPAGGVYTINPVGINPICNIPGHILANVPK
jgi:flagellar biosynthesis GTPase FlhF